MNKKLKQSQNWAKLKSLKTKVGRFSFKIKSMYESCGTNNTEILEFVNEIALGLNPLFIHSFIEMMPFSSMAERTKSTNKAQANM